MYRPDGDVYNLRDLAARLAELGGRADRGVLGDGDDRDEYDALRALSLAVPEWSRDRVLVADGHFEEHARDEAE